MDLVRAAAALAAFLALAGCAGSPAAPPPDMPAPDEAAMETAQVTLPLEVALAYRTSAVGSAQGSVLSNSGGAVTVPQNATLLGLEATWDCPSPALCGLTLLLFDRDGVVAEATGTSPLSLSILTPAAGSYQVHADAPADSATLAARGTIVASVTAPVA